MSNEDNITGPFTFKIDVPDDVALDEGDAAADHIISGGHMIDYLKVARALKVGQRIAASQAGAQQGRGYNEAFSRWLAQHPRLKRVSGNERAAALWCLEAANWPRVEEFLTALSVDQRQKTNLRSVRRHLDPAPADSARASRSDRTYNSELSDVIAELTEANEAYDILEEKARLIIRALERIGLGMTEEFREIIVVDRKKFKRWLDSMTIEAAP